MFQTKPWFAEVDNIEEGSFTALIGLNINIQLGPTTFVDMHTTYHQFQQLLQRRELSISDYFSCVIICFDDRVESSNWRDVHGVNMLCFRKSMHHFVIKIQKYGARSLGYYRVCPIHGEEEFLWRW